MPPEQISNHHDTRRANIDLGRDIDNITDKDRELIIGILNGPITQELIKTRKVLFNVLTGNTRNNSSSLLCLSDVSRYDTDLEVIAKSISGSEDTQGKDKYTQEFIKKILTDILKAQAVKLQNQQAIPQGILNPKITGRISLTQVKKAVTKVQASIDDKSIKVQDAVVHLFHKLGMINEIEHHALLGKLGATQSDIICAISQIINDSHNDVQIGTQHNRERFDIIFFNATQKAKAFYQKMLTSVKQVIADKNMETEDNPRSPIVESTIAAPQSDQSLEAEIQALNIFQLLEIVFTKKFHPLLSRNNESIRTVEQNKNLDLASALAYISTFLLQVDQSEGRKKLAANDTTNQITTLFLDYLTDRNASTEKIQFNTYLFLESSKEFMMKNETATMDVRKIGDLQSTIEFLRANNEDINEDMKRYISQLNEEEINNMYVYIDNMRVKGRSASVMKLLGRSDGGADDLNDKLAGRIVPAETKDILFDNEGNILPNSPERFRMILLAIHAGLSFKEGELQFLGICENNNDITLQENTFIVVDKLRADYPTIKLLANLDGIRIEIQIMDKVSYERTELLSQSNEKNPYDRATYNRLRQLNTALLFIYDVEIRQIIIQEIEKLNAIREKANAALTKNRGDYTINLGDYDGEEHKPEEIN